MYSTKEKLRILREINNPDAVGADLELFRRAMPADPRLVKFNLSPQRHHEEITLSLLERFTREEIVANRREYSKSVSTDKTEEDNSDLESMSDEEREILKGYNRAQRDRIKAICADAKGLEVVDALRAEGFTDIADKIEAENSNQGTGDGTGEGSGEGSGEGTGEGSGDGTGTGDENQDGNGNGDKTDGGEKPADEPEKEEPVGSQEKENPSDEAAAGEETKKKSGRTRNTQE